MHNCTCMFTSNKHFMIYMWQLPWRSLNIKCTIINKQCHFNQQFTVKIWTKYIQIWVLVNVFKACILLYWACGQLHQIYGQKINTMKNALTKYLIVRSKGRYLRLSCFCVRFFSLSFLSSVFCFCCSLCCLSCSFFFALSTLDFSRFSFSCWSTSALFVLLYNTDSGTWG